MTNPKGVMMFHIKSTRGSDPAGVRSTIRYVYVWWLSPSVYSELRLELDSPQKSLKSASSPPLPLSACAPSGATAAPCRGKHQYTYTYRTELSQQSQAMTSEKTLVGIYWEDAVHFSLSPELLVFVNEFLVGLLHRLHGLLQFPNILLKFLVIKLQIGYAEHQIRRLTVQENA